MLVGFLLGALLAADAAGYQVSVRSETRSGSVAAAGVPSPSLIEQIDVLAGVSGTTGRARADAAYAPILLYDFRTQRDPDVLHRGFATEIYRLGRGSTLTVGQDVAYGQRDFRPLTPQPADPSRILPQVQDPRTASVGVIPYLQWGASVGLDQTLATGIVLGLHTSYGASGGADARAREVLPLQHTAGGSARLGWALDHRDALGFSTSFSRTATGPATSSSLVASALGIDHRFNTSTEGSLGAGASISRDELDGVSTRAPIRPTALAGVTHSEMVFGRKVVSAARVALDTAVDPLGSGTYSRVEGSLSVGFVPLRDLSFQVRGSGARALTRRPELQNSLWQLEGTSSYAFARHMDASIGCRTAWAEAAGTPRTMQWSGFASLGFAYGERF
jgi:hypothetical protein